MAISRREFLCACGGSLILSTLIGGRAAEATISDPDLSGCVLDAATAEDDTLICGTVSTTGNALLDAAFQREFEQQREFFGLTDVTWQFVDDCKEKNAFASPETQRIYFGVNLTKELYTTYATTLPLWQVMAHEFGHQMQYTHGDFYRNDPSVMRTELEADMFSGFYLGAAKNTNPAAEVQTILPVAFDHGDIAYNDPGHHGTPEQRMAAVLHGIVVFAEAYNGSIERTWDTVRARFARSLPS